VTYETPQALRTALEHRLRNRSIDTGIGVDRLRRRVLFERIVARLQAAEPGLWILKGGMALEVRLRDNARLTRDIDLGLRAEVDDAAALHERLVDALSQDPDVDGFEFAASVPEQLSPDGGGHVTWRAKVAANLAGKPFGGVQLDISPRVHELLATDRVTVPNSLDLAGITATVIEIVDVHRHAAEKYHAMLRSYGDRENSRVRDLVDIVILCEHEQLDALTLVGSLRQVWQERDAAAPPHRFPALPESWPVRYERLASEARPRHEVLHRSRGPCRPALVRDVPP
jgi:hypothetical protein